MAGFLFGSHPWVKENFELVVFAIIGLSLLPIVFEVIKHKLKKSG
jgi:membrane-associated protein